MKKSKDGGSLSELKRQPDENLLEYQMRLFKNKDDYGLSYDDIADLINIETGQNYSESKYRKYMLPFIDGYEFALRKKLSKEKTANEADDLEATNYKNTVEILSDGSHRSNRLLKMSAEQAKDKSFLLKAHGYDEKEWELISAKNNIWNTYSKRDGVLTLYSSKITVRPLKHGFDYERFLEKVNEKIEPIHKKSVITDGENLLEIPLFDMHFGITDYDYYKPVQEKIIEIIQSKTWDRIFFIVGQDLLHNNGFSGKTSKGTPIDKVDMTKAWEDAYKFYCELLIIAQEHAHHVDVSYSIANHDDSMSWAFVKTLEAKFPDISFDTDKRVRKAYIWNKVFIGYTHGHKGANRLHESFLADFGKQMATANVVEIHSGHLHSEKAKDKFGVLIRTLSTKVKTDEWHEDEGFVGAHKRFQLFEYSPDSLKTIYYV